LASQQNQFIVFIYTMYMYQYSRTLDPAFNFCNSNVSLSCYQNSPDELSWCIM